MRWRLQETLEARALMQLTWRATPRGHDHASQPPLHQACLLRRRLQRVAVCGEGGMQHPTC